MHDVLIIGAGPTGLMAAERLSELGYGVVIVDQMPSPARKFLLAGRGGLNLTHSEDINTFVARYREANSFISEFLTEFSPQDLIDWCHGLGQETFVGSSGRVFPKSMKASPLLRAWLRRLDSRGVELRTRHRFCGFDDSGSAMVQPTGEPVRPFPARSVLLALGGASWPKLGSDAAWVNALGKHDVAIRTFQPSNCGFMVPWSDHLKTRFAGHPLKRIRLTLGDVSVLGEAVVSEQGIEGGAIYALSANIRDTINQNGNATVQIDFRPALSLEALTERLSRPRGKQSMATYLKKSAKLNPLEQALLREAGALPTSPIEIAQRIKALPVRCVAPYPIERAISSAGGISLEEVDANLMIRKLPGVFAGGEMLNWEAPTGGYLLQACFAMGVRAAKGIDRHLKTENRENRS